MSTTLENIAEKEGQNFLTGFAAADADGFNNVDLSGIPNFNKPKTEETATADGDKHGLNRVVLPGANGLRAFTANPDGESLERLASETNNPELAKQIAAEKAAAVAQEFVAKTAQYVTTPENYSAILGYMSQKYLGQNREFFEDEADVPLALLESGHWNMADLTAAFRYLAQRGVLEMPRGVAKVLSESEKLHCISLAANGQVADCIDQYLNYALPSAESDWSDTDEFLSDPQTVEIRNTAVRFAWLHSHPSVQDSAEFQQFERKFFKHRPLNTIPLMEAAYAAFQQEYKTALRDRLFGNQPAETAPSNGSLDDLNDEQVNSLYRRTARELARSAPPSNNPCPHFKTWQVKPLGDC